MSDLADAMDALEYSTLDLEANTTALESTVADLRDVTVSFDADVAAMEQGVLSHHGATDAESASLDALKTSVGLFWGEIDPLVVSIQEKQDHIASIEAKGV